MAGEKRSPIIKSDNSFYGGGASSPGCGTPRHHWRSVSWTARSREREAAERSALAPPGAPGTRPTLNIMASEQQNPGAKQRGGELPSDSSPHSNNNKSTSNSNDSNDFDSKQTQLLCPPLSSLSVSRRSADGAVGVADGQGGAAGGTGDERKYRKFGRGRNGLDIKLDLVAVRQVNFQENDAAEPTDSELSQKREKMAFCEKQCSRIRPHLYFGSSLVAQNFEMLRSHKITHIINCVGYVCSEYFPSSFEYRVLWLQDSPSEDIFSVLYDCFDFIEDVKAQYGRIYVHCCQGVSRSAAIVIAYLMWREGRTFEDVFEDVKALRTVTSPNMGFVFQLMNWQSRIMGSPKTPSLRMFRMAPHSPYDPLHQVPKAVANPSLSALDSRGAFVIHSANRLYVWQGRHCPRCMATAADKVAFQLIRYERALGPILCAKEGSEPQELQDALMNSKFAAEDGGPEDGFRSRDTSDSPAPAPIPAPAPAREREKPPVREREKPPVREREKPPVREREKAPASEREKAPASEREKEREVERLSSVNENSPSAPPPGSVGCAQSQQDTGNETATGTGTATAGVLVNHTYDGDFEAFEKARSGEVVASLPDGANLRGWDGRWNTPRHDFCCGVLSSRTKR